MKRIFFFAVLFILSSAAQAQLNYGLYLRGSVATQTHSDPSTPEDGTTQWDNLSTFGAGAFLQKDFTRRLGVKSRLLWQKKGFSESADFGIVGSPIFFENATFQNTFDCLSADLLGHVYLLKRSKIDLFFQGGGELSYLLKYKLESDITPNNLFYPMNSYGSGFNKWNASWIVGLGCTLNQIVSLELEVNRDFTPTLKKENLVVKNWLWSLGMNISIPRIFR